MFESTITEYLDKTKNKDWSILGILEFSRLNSKLSVATIKDFKEDLYAILSKCKDKCNTHVNAKSKAKKILSNFDSMFFTAEVKQFVKDLEYHEEARVNVTSTYTVTVLKVRLWKSETSIHNRPMNLPKFFRISKKIKNLLINYEKHPIREGKGTWESY